MDNLVTLSTIFLYYKYMIYCKWCGKKGHTKKRCKKLARYERIKQLRALFLPIKEKETVTVETRTKEIKTVEPKIKNRFFYSNKFNEYVCPFCGIKHKRVFNSIKIHPERCDSCHRRMVLREYTV